MVISDRLELAFLHIPKCAGSTIRNALRHVDSYRFEGYFDYPDGGRQNIQHLPLPDVRTHFPDVFEKIERYRSYAIIRQPRDRFASALLQYLTTVRKIAVGRHSHALFEQTALEVCARLENAPARAALELMHFQKQSSFVNVDGKRIVRDLYRFDALARFADDLQARHGVKLDIGVPHNQGYLNSGRVLQLLKRTGRRFLRGLGPDHLRRLRARTRGALGSPAHLYSRLFENRDIAIFVDRFYSEDWELYEGLGDLS